MRLDRYLALCGAVSRADARALLRAGRVFINGRPALSGNAQIDEAADTVTLDGAPLRYKKALHLMLYKPAGVLTAADDPSRKTVMDLLPREAAARSCMPVGRLDLDAEGLLLLTTDGRLAHRLLSPKRHVDKRYYVELAQAADESDAEAFRAGLVLSDFTALPAELILLPGGTSAEVVVVEGKYHQVKRMFASRGNRVTYLKRLSFGGVTLDPALAPGAWRELTEAEIGLLYAAAGGKPDA